MNGEPRVVVLPDADAVGLTAGEHIADTLRRAVEGHGRAHWATTGGSAAVGIYQALAGPLRDRVPWQGVHIWWGDDRYIGRDHKLSNVFAAGAILLSMGARTHQSGWGEDAYDVRQAAEPGAQVPPQNVHAYPMAHAIGEQLGPAWVAAQYEHALRAADLPVENGWPVFDLVILGVGPDGHILSVFPGSDALDEPRAWALAIPAPTHVEPHIARVTLNPRILDVARDVLIVTHGEGKAEVLGEVFGAERDPRRWPAQLVRRPGATWILDEAAASRLPAGLRS